MPRASGRSGLDGTRAQERRQAEPYWTPCTVLSARSTPDICRKAGASCAGCLDMAASLRFTYRDVKTTKVQGTKINQALKASGFCKV
ncbi:hypothetical protein [Streptomyces sp. NPDC058268]|uniref:hypothetical protein n=1 Tax=Streptomyces sp. NPDC058268 TaxID=3346413 RepID=UPI0036E7D69F